MSESERVLIPKQPGSHYTNEQRRSVIADYFVTGNITKTAEMNNMPRRTVGTWIKSSWGIELLAEVRHEKGEEFDANITKLIDSAFEAAQDRVTNGDQKLVKVKKAIKHEGGSMEMSEDYELKRQPMTGKDLAVVAGISYEKRQLHRNQPTAIRGDSSTVQALADEFRKLSADHKAIQDSVVSVQENSNGKFSGQR